ncbi:MAG: hypothetical protein U5R06_24255 [candidate division KSB1 bacterium]|nr:hypothetical protein [candidate division KSB1 bacterium]
MNILFICSGNICRSPAAKALLQNHLPRSAGDKVKVDSAGTLGIEGQPAPDALITLFAEKEIGLFQHRSKGVTDELVEAADLVLGMAPEHLKYLMNQFPGIEKKLDLLGHYGRPEPYARKHIIQDPYGGSIQEYKQAVDRIEQEVARITPILLKQRSD